MQPRKRHQDRLLESRPAGGKTKPGILKMLRPDYAPDCPVRASCPVSISSVPAVDGHGRQQQQQPQHRHPHCDGSKSVVRLSLSMVLGSLGPVRRRSDNPCDRRFLPRSRVCTVGDLRLLQFFIVLRTDYFVQITSYPTRAIDMARQGIVTCNYVQCVKKNRNPEPDIHSEPLQLEQAMGNCCDDDAVAGWRVANLKTNFELSAVLSATPRSEKLWTRFPFFDCRREFPHEVSGKIHSISKCRVPFTVVST